MPSNSIDRFPRLDPYMASSLLQKAIRRGDAHLAIQAAQSLHRQRGNAIWRRLLIVAFEDIGIGDLRLVQEVTRRIGEHLSNPVPRAATELMVALCSEMSKAVKSRATDHLVSAALHRIRRVSPSRCAEESANAEIIALAADPDRSMVERAVALIDPGGSSERSRAGVLSERLRCVLPFLPEEIADTADTTLLAFRLLKQDFVLTLPLIHAGWIENDQSRTVIEQAWPDAEQVEGLPTYIFDKHTAIGKRAIRIFADRNSDLRGELDRHVLHTNVGAVACMAAFHVDAVPLNAKLTWPLSSELERLGLEADMYKAGCPSAGVDGIMSAVERNLPHLNAIRRELFEGRAAR